MQFRSTILGFSVLGLAACGNDESSAPLSITSTRVWLKGDLHAHSRHSDGRQSAGTMVQKAAELGFNYFALSDHDNLQAGRIRNWFDSEYRSKNLTLLAAVEWTTVRGHANLYYTEPFDYRAFWRFHTGFRGQKMLQEAARNDILACANHPDDQTVWGHWRFKAHAPCLEIWNGDFVKGPNNNQAMNRWDLMLRQGYRVVGVGGSDAHDLQTSDGKHRLGFPTTWIHAQSQTPTDIFRALKEGRVSISESPHAPRLDLQIVSQEKITGIGEVTQSQTGIAHIRITVDKTLQSDLSGQECRAVLIGDIGTVTEKLLPCDKSQHIVFPITSLAQTKYLRASLFNLSGPTRVIATTNPVYISRSSEHQKSIMPQ